MQKLFSGFGAFLLSAAMLAFSMPVAAADPFKIPDQVPPLTAPVMDLAGMLTPNTAATLNRMLFRLHDGGGSQIAVLTVPDLGGLSIEEVGIKVADKWKVGEAKTDRGVILLVAKAERRIRIEVGQGNEGVLPDIIAKRIIDEVMTPRLRSGSLDQGVVAGVVEIIRRTDPDFDVGAVRESRGRRRGSGGGSFTLLLLLVIVGFAVRVLSALGGQGAHHGSNWRGGGFGGGGFGGGGFGGGGGSFGGGGFGGGGGGFSGGGSSGGW